MTALGIAQLPNTSVQGRPPGSWSTRLASPECIFLLTRSEEPLSFPVSRGLEYTQNPYIKKCTTSYLLVEATPYLGKGQPANARLVRTSMKPGRNPTGVRHLQCSMSIGTHPKSSPPTTSNVISTTGATDPQVHATHLRMKTPLVRKLRRSAFSTQHKMI